MTGATVNTVTRREWLVKLEKQTKKTWPKWVKLRHVGDWPEKVNGLSQRLFFFFFVDWKWNASKALVFWPHLLPDLRVIWFVASLSSLPSSALCYAYAMLRSQSPTIPCPISVIMMCHIFDFHLGCDFNFDLDLDLWLSQAQIGVTVTANRKWTKCQKSIFICHLQLLLLLLSVFLLLFLLLLKQSEVITVNSKVNK